MKCIYSFCPGHLEYEQNDMKVKGKHIFKEMEEHENPMHNNFLHEEPSLKINKW